MRYLIPVLAVFSFVLLVGCASNVATDLPKHTCCANSPSGTCVDCPACSAGHACADCAGNCSVTTTPTACAACVKGDGAAKCATCAAGQACTECASKNKKACATCASGEPCAECAAKKKEKSGKAEPAAETAEPVATINAKGMGCPLCASSADRRLKKVDGVKWTNIDLGNGIVTVGLDPEKPAPAAEDLQAAIRDAGFTAEEVTMPDSEVTP